jgi:ParB/RepB/Spo0J family partition protein
MTRVDPLKARRGGKKVELLDPAQTLKEHGVHGSHPEVVSGQPVAVVSSRRLQTIPIVQIRPGRFQKRESVDPEKFQQLKDQISELGFNFVAILFIDQDDPNYFNPAMGGHLRIQAARELGITEILAIVREFDDVALAKGTYMENQARQQLTIIEEGLIFQECQETLGWTQEEIAKNLIVPGGRSHVAVCMLAVTAAPDLREMLRKDPRRGQRAFYYFRQLDELGEKRAMELRAPHIENFLLGKISTDEVRLIMKQILDKEHGQDLEPISLEQVRREHKLTSSMTSFQRFERDLGTGQPSEAERESLRKLKKKIDEILER